MWPSGCFAMANGWASSIIWMNIIPPISSAPTLRKSRQLATLSSSPSIFVTVRNCAKYFQHFNPDAVIHLAARPGVRMSFAQPEAYTSINVLGTTQLLEMSRLWGIKRFVFASSSSVYGHSSRAPFREDAAISHPLSIYAATKVAGEALAFTYSHAYNLPVICLRLFTVYGPRQRPDLAIRKFAEMILAGEGGSHIRRWQPGARLHLYRRHRRWHHAGASSSGEI